MSRTLDRRAVLRGLVGGSAVAVGLPLLDLMLDGNGEALATGLPLPDRFGVWFWGNGVRPDKWRPTGTTNWTPSESLQPLADLVPYLSVLSGFGTKTPYWAHHSGVTAIMTGAPYYQLGTTRDTIVSTFGRKSVDQDAADALGGQTAFRSIELGVCRFTGTDEGTSFQHLSHNGPNNPNPSEYSPSALYARLFSAPTTPELDLVRLSVLDGVKDQVSRLQGRLGVRDRTRLEQHLDSIRTLEQRLAAAPAECAPGASPQDVADVGGLEQIEEKNRAMVDVLTLALACDLTRVFAFQYSVCGGGNVFWQVGMADGLHSQTHLEPPPQPVVQAQVVFTMERLGEFLRALRDTPDGRGNLLDTCSILCTTEHSDGYTHSQDEFPILIAGKGNGRLRGGVHFRGAGVFGQRNTSDAVLTALHGAGVQLPAWGEDAGRTTSVVSDVLT
jgi:hypothetical protein